MRIGMFYGSTTGNTGQIAEEIRDGFGEDLIEVFEDVADVDTEEMLGFDVLILGIPTWDIGELQSDWGVHYDDLDGHDFTGTKIVMFGVGDQDGYPDNFLDAMGMLYDALLARGATGGIGFWPTEGYGFQFSKAQKGDKFCGLGVDEDNETDLTPERVATWCAQVKSELGL